MGEDGDLWRDDSWNGDEHKPTSKPTVAEIVITTPMPTRCRFRSPPPTASPELSSPPTPFLATDGALSEARCAPTARRECCGSNSKTANYLKAAKIKVARRESACTSRLIEMYISTQEYKRNGCIIFSAEKNTLCC